MENTSIKDLLAGKIVTESEVKTCGWVKTRRDSKAGFSFIAINDGSCFATLQIVAANTLANYADEILTISPGCSIIATGKLVESPAKGQAYELQATNIEILGTVANPETYPITPKHHTLEYLREHAHLRPRTNVIGAVTRMRNSIANAIHKFFQENGFLWIATPIITANDCEGAGELFRVSTLDLMNPPKKYGKIDFEQDFFGKETFLTVSGQLNVESYCLAMSKVYTFGPTFRAENSNTSRHLAEFWMVEPEIAFANLDDICLLAEKMLKHTCQTILNEREDDIDFFTARIDKHSRNRIEHIINSDFAHMEYSDAIAVLEKANKKFEFPIRFGCDLQSEHERFLTEEYAHKPVIIKNFPKDIKAFYMRQNDDNKTVAALDVLAPGIGEIIGGSQREERLEKLDRRMQELNINPEPLSWYRDLRQFGTVPHGGFGLGLERFIGYVTGMNNIRDVIPFPRTPKHAEF